MRPEEPDLTDPWLETVPVLADFAQVAETSRYAPLPDDWRIGVSDVINSTAAIESGRYKAVNLAGAGTISAVANALEGHLPLFAFGGDGARFAVPPDQADIAADALSRVAGWAERELGLRMRVGMTCVSEVRAAGSDARAAFWQASEHVRYAMFAGGGLEWAEAQLKAGVIGLPTADEEPNLTGLSCQWGPILPTNGTIVSLIVKPGPAASETSFAETTARLVELIEECGGQSPLPEHGPEVRWPSGEMGLQSRIAQDGRSLLSRRIHVLATASLSWLVFKLGLRIRGFDPDRYRREIAVNTDFRKFDDGVMMTVDCTARAAMQIRRMLDRAVADGSVRYGLHEQEAALMTCIAPSLTTSDHMHFIDGAGGGYASAARQMR
jgi:hypothetical protein